MGSIVNELMKMWNTLEKKVLSTTRNYDLFLLYSIKPLPWLYLYLGTIY